jgi:hypothetical protein
MNRIFVAAMLGVITFAAQAQMLGIAAPVSALHTTVSGRNVGDISKDVQGWHDMQHPNCKFVRVLSAEEAEKSPDGVSEHWTIEACERQQFTYRVYIIKSNGAITDSVSNVDGSPLVHAKS